jgi:hypothetical protein
VGRCPLIRGDGGGGLGDIRCVAYIPSLNRCASCFHPVRKPNQCGQCYSNGALIGMIRRNFLSIILTLRIRPRGFTTITPDIMMQQLGGL